MADFLTHLVQRTQSRLPIAQPLWTSRFAPGVATVGEAFTVNLLQPDQPSFSVPPPKEPAVETKPVEPVQGRSPLFSPPPAIPAPSTFPQNTPPSPPSPEPLNEPILPRSIEANTPPQPSEMVSTPISNNHLNKPQPPLTPNSTPPLPTPVSLSAPPPISFPLVPSEPPPSTSLGSVPEAIAPLPETSNLPPVQLSPTLPLPAPPITPIATPTPPEEPSPPIPPPAIPVIPRSQPATTLSSRTLQDFTPAMERRSEATPNPIELSERRVTTGLPPRDGAIAAPPLPRPAPPAEILRTVSDTAVSRRTGADTRLEQAIPVIEVSIGRLEVRVKPAATASSKTRTQVGNSGPKVSLSDYLQSRNGPPPGGMP